MQSKRRQAQPRQATSVAAVVLALVLSVLAGALPTWAAPAKSATKPPAKPATKPTVKPTGTTTSAPKAGSAKPGAKGATQATAKKPAKITLGAVRQTQLARDRVRAKRAAASVRVNALKASQRRVTLALSDLNSSVRVTSVALDKAQRAAVRAERELSDASARKARTELKIGRLRQSRLQSALAAYAQPAASSLDNYINASSPSEAGRRQIYDTLAKRGTAQALDELSALQEDLSIERSLAARARKRATGYRSSVAGRLSSYQSARSDQQKFAAQLESRLESQLAESAALSDLDRGLSTRLASQNSSLARQLAAAGAGGRGGGRLVFSEIAASGGGDTHGIVVAAAIRGKLAAMLAAAQADGIYLTGGGYRSPSAQVQLRIAHCGGSSFAIYQMSASSCRPPTARPGASMHERGLAIDFQQGGGTLTRGSSAYAWLRRNAGRFGFLNLASEPWHWSINGR